MLSDAHFHITQTDFYSLLKDESIFGILNCDSKSEFDQHQKRLCKDSKVILSAGIHPWKAGESDWKEMETCFQQVAVIGEIGLDSVWCEVDMDVQMTIFKQQLAYGVTHKKPVILHTKGMEKEIAEIIKEYPNRYLVHWYSSMGHLDAYIEQDCYFSIGPSFATDAAVKQVVEKVPLNRLLVESDGIEAMNWAVERAIQVGNYVEMLTNTFNYLAKKKNIKIETAIDCVKENLECFIWTGNGNKS